MATGSTLSALDAIFKENYLDKQIANLTYKDNPAFALIKKNEKGSGRRIVQPVKYADSQGRSALFTQAQARSVLTASQVVDFLVTRVIDYNIATISTEAILASQGDADAFVSAVKLEMDGAINGLTNSIATALFRNGTGSIGQVSNSSFSGTSMTLTNASDVVNFEVGQELMVSSADGGATRAVGSSGNGLLVTGIDRDAGTLSFAAAMNDATNGIPLIAQNDYVSVRGDSANGGANVKLAGFEAWIPASAPSSTAFYGVDRTKDIVRLAGKRYAATGVPKVEALIEGAARLAREGASPDTAFVSFASFSAIEKALDSKVRYQDLQEKDTKIGFNSIVLRGPRGDINVVADRSCPDTRCFLMTLDSWELDTLGKAVRLISPDGLEGVRQSTADGVEYRWGMYGNLRCKSPGHNMNIQW